MKLDLRGDRGAALSAALGATGALLLALLIAPVLLLAVEAVAAGGTYAYSRMKRRDETDDVIDVEIKEDNK